MGGWAHGGGRARARGLEREGGFQREKESEKKGNRVIWGDEGHGIGLKLLSICDDTHVVANNETFVAYTQNDIVLFQNILGIFCVSSQIPLVSFLGKSIS